MPRSRANSLKIVGEHLQFNYSAHFRTRTSYASGDQTGLQKLITLEESHGAGRGSPQGALKPLKLLKIIAAQYAEIAKKAGLSHVLHTRKFLS